MFVTASWIEKRCSFFVSTTRTCRHVHNCIAKLNRLLYFKKLQPIFLAPVDFHETEASDLLTSLYFSCYFFQSLRKVSTCGVSLFVSKYLGILTRSARVLEAALWFTLHALQANKSALHELQVVLSCLFSKLLSLILLLIYGEVCGVMVGQIQLL